MWGAASGLELLRLKGHTGGVNSAVFSADGSRIVTASGDGTTRVWDSVLYRSRYQQRRALLTARPAAERALSDALEDGDDFVRAGERLHSNSALDPLVRHAALDLLIQRAPTIRDRTRGVSGGHTDAK